MTIWEVHTNEGKHYRRKKPTREEMNSYIRRKLKEGCNLVDIIFCWGPINVL